MSDMIRGVVSSHYVGLTGSIGPNSVFIVVIEETERGRDTESQTLMFIFIFILMHEDIQVKTRKGVLEVLSGRINCHVSRQAQLKTGNEELLPETNPQPIKVR